MASKLSIIVKSQNCSDTYLGVGISLYGECLDKRNEAEGIAGKLNAAAAEDIIEAKARIGILSDRRIPRNVRTQR